MPKYNLHNNYLVWRRQGFMHIVSGPHYGPAVPAMVDERMAQLPADNDGYFCNMTRYALSKTGRYPRNKEGDRQIEYETRAFSEIVMTISFSDEEIEWADWTAFCEIVEENGWVSEGSHAVVGCSWQRGREYYRAADGWYVDADGNDRNIGDWHHQLINLPGPPMMVGAEESINRDYD